jgi:hypothetical protein
MGVQKLWSGIYCQKESKMMSTIIRSTVRERTLCIHINLNGQFTSRQQH